MRLRPLLLGLLLLVPLAALAPPGATAAPRVDEPAPDFRFEGQDGATYALADYVGKKAVVIAWFPKAFTPG